MNTDNVKKRINQMIGYENFEREERIRLKKIKNFVVCFVLFTILLGGTITVNAMTDNGIVNKVKDAFHANIKVNGEEKNATCEKLENGNIKCSFGKEVMEVDAELDYEINKDYQEKIDVEMDISENNAKQNL